MRDRSPIRRLAASAVAASRPLIFAGALGSALMLSPASGAASTLAFSAHGAGPFDVRYIGGALLEESQTLAFDRFLPFPLTTGLYRDHLDFTVVNPDGSSRFPDAIVFSAFTLSDGGSNSLSGVYTVETSDFTDPVDPFSGDIVGAQDFGGHFTFTGGTGEYAGATGGGAYTGHGDFLAFDPADHPGAILVGDGEYTASGSVDLSDSVDLVPEPATWGLMLAGFGLAGAALRRCRPARRGWLGLSAITAGLLLASSAAPASAAAVATYTFTGTVGSGVDFGGVFGAAGRDLGGFGFTAVFVRDDAGANASILSDADNSEVAGSGLPPVLSGAITIDGVTLPVSGSAFGQQYQAKISTFEQFEFDDLGLAPAPDKPGFNQGSYLQVGALDFAPEYLTGPDYHSLTSLPFGTTPHLEWYGAFSIFNEDVETLMDVTYLVNLALSPTTLTVDGGGSPGVPEPATWGLMLTGFGVAGAALRHRRAVAA